MLHAWHTNQLNRIVAMFIILIIAMHTGLLMPRVRAAATPTAVPVITAGTYLGGSSDDNIHGIAVDSSGIYVTGSTYSRDFPGVAAALKGNTDLFVSKISLDGRVLIWSVLLGGGDDEDGTAIALDSQGGIWVTGSSESTDFPTTPNALQNNFGGFADAIVIRLDASSGALRYATYMGGGGFDQGAAIGADGAGAVYMTGVANEDVLVMRMNIADYTPIYAGVIEASGEDRATALAIDAGRLFITGSTTGRGTSNDYPLVNALQTECGIATSSGSCGQDAFITAISPDGEIIYSTFLGGSYAGSDISSGGDEGRAIAIDSDGNILVAGITLAGDFPTSNAIQSAPGGAGNIADAFLTKISPDGAQILFSTYLGGAEWDEARALAVDAAGAVVVAGITGSPAFPIKDAFQPVLGNGVCELGGAERYCNDAFVMRVNSSGALEWSSFLGGGFDDSAFGLALDANSAIMVAGQTRSAPQHGFPMTSGGLQATKAFGNDGFILRMSAGAALNYRVSLPLVVH